MSMMNVQIDNTEVQEALKTINNCLTEITKQLLVLNNMGILLKPIEDEKEGN